MQKRPILKLRLTRLDITCEAVGYLLLLLIWLLTLYHYQSLPDVIPVHFDAFGNADGFGKKITLFSLPIVASVLFTGMTILNKFPHHFNYPLTITEDNALRQYTFATRLIRFLKISILTVFGCILAMTIIQAKWQSAGLGIWFLPLLLVLIFLPLFYYLLKALKEK